MLRFIASLPNPSEGIICPKNLCLQPYEYRILYSSHDKIKDKKSYNNLLIKFYRYVTIKLSF